MITKILCDEYLVAFKIKKYDVRKVLSTLPEETRHWSNAKIKSIDQIQKKIFLT